MKVHSAKDSSGFRADMPRTRPSQTRNAPTHIGAESHASEAGAGSPAKPLWGLASILRFLSRDGKEALLISSGGLKGPPRPWPGQHRLPVCSPAPCTPQVEAVVTT